MKQFEQMTTEEQLKHLKVDHGIDDAEMWFTGAPDDAEAHQIDHDEWLADQHEHDKFPGPPEKYNWHEGDITCIGSIGQE